MTYYLGQAFAGDTDKLACAVGRVVHRGKTVPPGALAIPEIKALQAGVLVFGFRVIEGAEFALLVELAGGDCGLLVMAGLGHHIGQAVFFDRVEE